MDTGDFVLDSNDIAALAFRLTWPGDEPSAVIAPPARKRLPLPAPLMAYLARRKSWLGWPVAITVPSAASAVPRQPSVKLTGSPLG